MGFKQNVTGSFGGAAEGRLKIRNVCIIPRDLVDACSNTADVTLPQVPDNKTGVTNLGQVPLANGLWSQQMNSVW